VLRKDGADSPVRTPQPGAATLDMLSVHGAQEEQGSTSRWAIEGAKKTTARRHRAVVYRIIQERADELVEVTRGGRGRMFLFEVRRRCRRESRSSTPGPANGFVPPMSRPRQPTARRC